MKKKSLSLITILSFAVLAYFAFIHLKPSPFSEKIIFCGVCKNVAKALPSTIASVEELGQLFSDYKVFIYENNSTDRTPELLLEWTENNPHISVISEKISQEKLYQLAKAHTKDHLPFRTEIISRARNKVLRQALHPDFDDYKYVVVFDMDFPKKWNLSGIIDSFHRKEQWDALFANGIDQAGRTYDRYAFRGQQFPFGPELIGDTWWDEIRSLPLIIPKNGPLVPVYSAFGGLAIYKRHALKGCSYSGTVNADLEALTAQILSKGEQDHQDHILKYLHLKELSHQFSSLRDNNAGIRWVWNSGGFGFPVCCEHLTLHASMILKGNGKLYINPQMIMKYKN